MLGIGNSHTNDPNGIAWKQNKDFEALLRRLNEGRESDQTQPEVKEEEEEEGAAEANNQEETKDKKRKRKESIKEDEDATKVSKRSKSSPPAGFVSPKSIVVAEPPKITIMKVSVARPGACVLIQSLNSSVLNISYMQTSRA